MRRWLLAGLFLLCGCGADLIAPEDPGYEDLCVVYVGEAQGAEITRAAFDKCQTIEIVVVRFTI